MNRLLCLFGLVGVGGFLFNREEKLRMKKKTHKRLFRSLFAILLMSFLGSGAVLAYELVIAPAQNQNTLNQYKDLLYGNTSSSVSSGQSVPDVPASSDTSSEPSATEPLEVLDKFRPLLNRNEDTAGWLKIPGTSLDHPVFFTPDNPDYYLKKDPDGRFDKYGSLYIAGNCALSPQSQILVMYGHNMEYDDLMFGQLMLFKKFDFLKKHPTFTFDTIYREGQWKIIAVCRASKYETALFPYTNTGFVHEEQFNAYIYQARIRSAYYIPDDPRMDDSYLVMSTCDYFFWGDRTVIIARRLRDDESMDAVDTSAYQKNPVRLWPDRYYALDFITASRPSDEAIRDGYEAFYRY